MFRVRIQHYIERMNDAWYIAQQGQHKIEPKMACQTNLTQHAERWEDNGKDYFERVGDPGDHGTLLTESTSRTSELVRWMVLLLPACTAKQFPYHFGALFQAYHQHACRPGLRLGGACSWATPTVVELLVCTE